MRIGSTRGLNEVNTCVLLVVNDTPGELRRLIVVRTYRAPEFWDECGVNIDGVKNTLEWGLVFNFGFDVLDEEGEVGRIGWDEKGASAAATKLKSALAAATSRNSADVAEVDFPAKMDRLVSKLSSGEVGRGCKLSSV